MSKTKISLAEALRNAANSLDNRPNLGGSLSSNQLRVISHRAERIESEYGVLLQAIEAGLSIFESYDEAQQAGSAGWLWLKRAEEILTDAKSGNDASAPLPFYPPE